VHRVKVPGAPIPSSGRPAAAANACRTSPFLPVYSGKEAIVGRIIVANRRGHQVVEWSTTDTEEARATVEEAERILREARAAGCAISKKVDGVHVLDRGEFDPDADEYQIVAPIAGG